MRSVNPFSFKSWTHIHTFFFLIYLTRLDTKMNGDWYKWGLQPQRKSILMDVISGDLLKAQTRKKKQLTKKSLSAWIMI